MTQQGNVQQSPHRLVVLEQNDRCEVNVKPGDQLSIGRHGDVPLGVDPEDSCISRSALTVAVNLASWQIEVTNFNGAWVRPWGSESSRLKGGHLSHLDRSHVCIDLIGSSHLRHRVLLERQEEPIQTPLTEAHFEEGAKDGRTDPVAAPRPLTEKQVAVLADLFEEFLEWPPRSSPQPRKIETVARRMGIHRTTLNEHLDQVLQRVNRTGFSPLRKTDPRLAFMLVENGLLTFSGARTAKFL